MLESSVEKYFQEEIKRHDGLPLKFKSPSTRGVPDQIVLYDGQTYFVEMKAPDEVPRKSQVHLHKIFKSKGINVYTIDSKEKTDTFIKDILKAKPVPKATKTFEIKDNMFH